MPPPIMCAPPCAVPVPLFRSLLLPTCNMPALAFFSLFAVVRLCVNPRVLPPKIISLLYLGASLLWQCYYSDLSHTLGARDFAKRQTCLRRSDIAYAI